MVDPQACSQRLELIYKYFSHHIRTNTSVVVAVLDVLREELTDESMVEMVMESGYLLDVFDRGMNIAFNHIFDKAESATVEDIDIPVLIELFKHNAVSTDDNEKLQTDIPQYFKVTCDSYTFKTIFQIFIHEAVLSADKTVEIKYIDDSLIVKPDSGFNELFPIFHIFAEILLECGITIDFNKSAITLRFV